MPLAVWPVNTDMATRGLRLTTSANAPAGIPAAAVWERLWPAEGLKLIVLESKGAPGVTIANKGLFDQGAKKLAEALREHAITKPKGGLNTYGTAVLVNIMNEAGGLPTRNFSSGRFEGAAKIAGEAIFEGVKNRLGKEVYNHACSPGCIIQCSNTWYKPDGTEHTSCVEYESDWALGANCGIDSLDDVAEMIRLCNAYGLDTIEAGTALAVAMEAGVIPFGDGKKAIQLVHEMGKGTPMGRILGGGTDFAGRAFGVTRVPTVKRQSMPAYEPRAVKGIGITYATTPMGADHTAGYTIAPEILSVGGRWTPSALKERLLSAGPSRPRRLLLIPPATVCLSPLPFWILPAALKE